MLVQPGRSRAAQPHVRPSRKSILFYRFVVPGGAKTFPFDDERSSLDRAERI